MSTTQPLPEWKSMTERERDAAIAEHVFGRRVMWLRGERDRLPLRFTNGDVVPRYTTDVNADFQVLQFVQQTWDKRERLMFSAILWETYENRYRGNDDTKTLVMRYKVGDYAIAAYECILQRHQQGGTE